MLKKTNIVFLILSAFNLNAMQNYSARLTYNKLNKHLIISKRFFNKFRITQKYINTNLLSRFLTNNRNNLIILNKELNNIRYMSYLKNLKDSVYEHRCDIDKLLIDAAEKGHSDSVISLLNSNFNINRDFINKALRIAAENGHADLVTVILNHGADIDSKNALNRTALIKAARNGHINTVKLLLDLGADIEKEDCLRDNALTNAVVNGHIDIVKLLLKYGAKIKSKALLDAARNGHLDILEVLSNHGAKIGNKIGEALVGAAANGHLDTVKYLLRHGVKIENEVGEALVEIARAEHIDVVNVLLNYCSNIKNRNLYYVNNALAEAVVHGNKDTVIALLNYGADPNSIDAYGNTVLESAKKRGYKDIINLLKKHDKKHNLFIIF